MFVERMEKTLEKVLDSLCSLDTHVDILLRFDRDNCFMSVGGSWETLTSAIAITIAITATTDPVIIHLAIQLVLGLPRALVTTFGISCTGPVVPLRSVSIMSLSSGPGSSSYAISAATVSRASLSRGT